VTPPKGPTNEPKNEPKIEPKNEPIDAVYTWAGGDAAVLRSSLRSLNKCAPWIRKVYVVTGGRAPGWLNRSHPRLSLVKHEEIFRDKNVLPTSDPELVAWQLFRIAGLSRQFLHLDANFFVGRPLEPAYFLTAKGGNRFYVEESDIPPGSIAEKLLNSRFGDRSPRKRPARTPRFLDKNFLEEVHRLWEKPIKQGGVSQDELYFYYLVESPLQYGIHEKTAVTSSILRDVPLSDLKQLAGLLRAQPQFFCLDGAAPGIGARLILKFFYWRRSRFER
jgi:hypothetical protein